MASKSDPYCACGCGQMTTKVKWSDASRGLVKGEYRMYCKNHDKVGATKSVFTKDGRPLVYRPDHPRAMSNGYVFEHLLIAEKALGYSVPKGVEVHHFDENKANNSPSNLVICPDRAYHFLLHQRQKAFDACGNPNWEKCQFCGNYDDPSNLKYRGKSRYHPKCRKY